MNILELGRQCLTDEADAIRALAEQLDDDFVRAVQMMYDCSGKVIVTGVGKSGHVGEKIAATLSSTGTPAFFINPLDAYHGDLGGITAQDVVLALSNSGNTDELLRLLPTLLHRHVPIIAMTRDKQSLLARQSHAVVRVSVAKESCPLNLAPTSSTTAQLAMGDALAVALMQKRNFQTRDFATFHPGGTLGRQLLTTAEDVMRADHLPLLPEAMTLSDALMQVSVGKMGLGISVDSDNRLIGMITNGDIRRAMERWQDAFFAKTVGEILQREPITVPPTTKISELLRIIREKKIHQVLVTDDSRHLLGVVDYYSCML